jgi:decaprenylphospho-beta-D-ribofuranose 2-oxidase
MKTVKTSGWGRTSWSSAVILESEQLTSANFKNASSKFICRGLGRSYGDSSLNEGGFQITVNTKKFIRLDENTGIVHLTANTTIGELEEVSLQAGFFPPVVPGTRFVTLGGAVASDIHGKSHHIRGSISDNLLSIELIDHNLETQFVYPVGSTSELFRATVGGMGLTGVILSITIQLIEIDSAYVNVVNTRVKDLSELIATLIAFDKNYEYTVAWVDVSGTFVGRGIVSGANHKPKLELSKRQLRRSVLSLKTLYSVPSWNKINFINKYTVRVFNELWYRKPLQNGLVSLLKFLHPLDFIGNWNRIYGEAGIIEWQFSIPLDASEFIEEALLELRKISACSFLGVIKTFSSSSSSYLSFTQPGISLSVDIPSNTKGLLEVLDRLDDKLTRIGGRIYLTKDSRLSRSNFQKMYPGLEKWLSVKENIDPNCFWSSDQSTRLGLTGDQIL